MPKPNRNEGSGKTYVTSKDVQATRNKYLLPREQTGDTGRTGPSPKAFKASDATRKAGQTLSLSEIQALAQRLKTKLGQDPTISNITNKKLWFIEFMHVPSGETVKFDGFLTQFNDQFTSDWNSEEILGRMDPIMTFKGTKRQMSLGWEIPAFSNDGALVNLNNANTLLKFLYPVYGRVSYQTLVRSTGKADSKKRQLNIQKTTTNSVNFLKKQTYGKSTYMVASPLFKVKFTNLICDSRGDITAGVAESGLVGVIDGFNFDPDLEAGFLGDKPGLLLPKVIRFQCNFTVLHTHKLGYAHCKGKYFGLPDNFPYSIEANPGAKKKRVQARIAEQRRQQAIFEEKRRKAMERKLAAKIDPNSELLTAIDFDNEIYDLETYEIKKQLKI